MRDKKTSRQNNMLIDWSHFETRTPKGTLLVVSTVEKAMLDLDAWAYGQRTGTAIMNSDFVVGWKSVLTKLGMIDAGGNLNIDRKQLWKALEQELDSYEPVYMQKRSGAPMLDPEVAKKTSEQMHKIFAARKEEEMEVGILAAFAAGIEGDPEEWKGNIRGAARAYPQHFSIGSGGAPKIRRLQKRDGKLTGVPAFDNTRKAGGTSNDDVVYMRMSKGVRELGFTTGEQFEAAKKSLGTKAPTVAQLRNWLATTPAK